ncbi:hypothetical protein JCM5296_005968 [Sporobolomyces johnsonii]
MTSSHISSSVSTTAPKRRASRRLQPEGEGESSREASAESNDETGQSGLEDDDETASLSGRTAAAGPSPSLLSGVQGLNLGGLGARARGLAEVASALPGPTGRRVLEDDTEGEESAGHDGDISSAPAPSTALPSRVASFHHQPHVHGHRAPLGVSPSRLHHQPLASDSSPPPTETDSEQPHMLHPKSTGGEVLWAAAPKGFLSNLSAEEIQEHIRSAIVGQPGRPYKIKPPPVGRPVRIYADGVYDLLHYGHMLQLRQCKLAFPSVHLLVGVCSSSLVREHKANPVLTSEERYESMRHIRWVDEVVEDAPWTVDQDFIDKWQIDYVAHDEEPYASAGQDDCYAYAKSIGAFLPTKRTNGISTSELLQRIVEGYREGDYDGKLRKIGHPELCSRQGSEAGGGGGGGSTRRESQV